ncbi:MAG: GNAT family N-acetyltransferase [Anaerolineae bacterium]|nr:GNAT family N-acetyltransferase [Anaerolineae bacterium]
MNDTYKETTPDIHFMRITVTTLNQICDLSETLSPVQRRMVADNVRSIAEAHFSESVWMRAVYADETPIGFIMTHTGSDYEDGIDCPGVFLWRFMIAGPYQGKGYGQRAIEKLIQHLRAMGIPLLYTSCGQGEGSPEGFYRTLGFTPTGGHYDDEIELILHLGDVDGNKARKMG